MQYKRECKMCGVMFETKHSMIAWGHTKYCEPCRYKHKLEDGIKYRRVHKEIVNQRQREKYAKKAIKMPMHFRKECKTCNKLFETKHTLAAWTQTRRCPECKKQTRMDYYQKNKEKILERQKTPKGKEYARQYYQKNKKKRLEQSRGWAINNPEKRRQHELNYRKRNRDRINERNREWRKRKKEQLIEL